MRRLPLPLLLALLLAAALWPRSRTTDSGAGTDAPRAPPDVAATGTTRAPPKPRPAAPAPAPTRTPRPASDLPDELFETLRLVESDGPFPYARDGVEFQNREKRLPAAPRGFYREYTVPTPGSRDRGARRLVTGGRPPSAWYYSDDHYRSFRTLTPADRGVE